jgi:hypothetical protein
MDASRLDYTWLSPTDIRGFKVGFLSRTVEWVRVDDIPAVRSGEVQ